MGTSGAYSGAGGKAGRDIRVGAGEWLDGLSDGELCDLLEEDLERE